MEQPLKKQPGWAAAISVHVFTASGAFVGFMALAAALQSEFTSMFLWLGLALVIDGVDGALARRARVDLNAPRWDGVVLDLVVDFTTYVVVPLIAIWRGDLLPSGSAVILCGGLAMASAMYFADTLMKTPDNWFRGFPALWNVVALYLFAFRLPSFVNAALLVVLAVLMFAPVVVAHPMRARHLRWLVLPLALAWLAAALVLVWSGFAEGWLARAVLLATGVMFAALPLKRSSTAR
jgi:phosphatidylcholine synthase